MLCVRVATLLCLAVGASAMRVQHKANATSAEESEFGCSDYCLQCNDGSTVWYGRSRSWFRSFVNLFTSGILVPVTMVGNMWMKSSNEEFSHWTGYLPTTGFFCEKVDIIKFPVEREEPFAFTPLMLADRNWFGRISLNELKPYYPETGRPQKEWAQPHDYEAYIGGCKTMKGAGVSGKASQLGSNFQSYCRSAVTIASYKCAEHSRLCGAAGVAKLTYAANKNECMAMKGDFNTPAYCRR
jgi:hypothetical protein